MIKVNNMVSQVFSINKFDIRLDLTSFNTTRTDRRRHQRCSIKTGVLKNFAKFRGKHLLQSLFLNKVAGLRPATLLKKRLWHMCFPVNFAKYFRTTVEDCF